MLDLDAFQITALLGLNRNTIKPVFARQAWTRGFRQDGCLWCIQAHNVVSTPRSSQTAVNPRSRGLSGAVLPWVNSFIPMAGAVTTAWSMSVVESTCESIMDRMNCQRPPPYQWHRRLPGLCQVPAEPVPWCE